jgi:hypothetical protein
MGEPPSGVKYMLLAGRRATRHPFTIGKTVNCEEVYRDIE